MSEPRDTVTLSRPVFGLGVMSIVVLFVVCIGLAVVVQANANQIDKLEDSVAYTRTSVDELTEFVDELQQPPSAEEQARNEAISAAVRLVPEVKDILCEQFPQATACNVP